MNLTPNNTTFDPQTLVQKAADEIIKTAEQEDDTEAMLQALQSHYDTLHSNQQMYINYLTEFVDKLKTVQQADKESFTKLKKEVIKHVLDSEKKKIDSQRV